MRDPLPAFPGIPLERLLERFRKEGGEAGFFAGKDWVWAPTPFAMPPDHAGQLEPMGRLLLRFVRACELLYRQSIDGRQPPWVAELLDRGKSPEVIALGRDPAFRGDIAGIIRPDLVMTEEGFSICELDQIPGGIGLTAWLNEIYSDHGFPVLGGREGMLGGFAGVLPQGEILVSEEAATYRPEMEWIASRLNVAAREKSEQLSWSVSDCAHREDFSGKVYRFFELFDLKNVPCSDILFRAAREGRAVVTPPPKAQLEEKLWMALFWMHPLEDFWTRQLGESGVKMLRKWIPYTWVVDPAPLPPYAVYPGLGIQDWRELAGFSQKRRELILKISGFHEQAWGARGVSLGSDLSGDEWESVVLEALAGAEDHPRILQVYSRPILSEQPFYNPVGEVCLMKGRARVSPYFFVTGEKSVTLGGVLSTVCPADKKILHGMRDAVMVPAMVAGSSMAGSLDSLQS